jgi:hypothetical protein
MGIPNGHRCFKKSWSNNLDGVPWLGKPHVGLHISKYQLFWWCDTCLRCSFARVSGSSVDCLTISGNSRHELLLLSPCLVLEVPPTRSTLNTTSNARVGWVGFPPIHGHFGSFQIKTSFLHIWIRWKYVEICGRFPQSPRDFPGRSSSLPLKPPAIRWIRWMRQRLSDIVGWKQQVLETGWWCDNWLVNSDG